MPRSSAGLPAAPAAAAALLDPRTTGTGRPRGTAARHHEPVGQLEAADEDRVVTEWCRHIAGWQALKARERAAARQAAASALDKVARRFAAESHTGRHRPSHRHDRPARTQRGNLARGRTVLVVVLDGEPLASNTRLGEILLCMGNWEDDDRRDRPLTRRRCGSRSHLPTELRSPPRSAFSRPWRRPPRPGVQAGTGCSPQTAATSTRR